MLLSKNPVTVECFSSPISYFCDKNKGNLAFNQSSNLETCIFFALIFMLEWKSVRLEHLTSIVSRVFRIKINRNCNFVGLLHHPFWLQRIWALSDHCLQHLNYFVWSRINDEGSLPEMRIWSIFFIKSDLKWCIHLSRSLFLYED